MEKYKVPRILIAGTGSGSGKTMITCGLLNCFLQKGLAPTSFKCGPDYIDTMFHSRVLSIPSGNLDSFFTDEKTLRALFLKHGRKKDISVIEGVMGYYDGIGFSHKGSSAEIAEITKTPVILIVNCKGMSNSIGALLKGFVSYREPSMIKGVIFNRLPESLYEGAKQLAIDNGLISLGYLPFFKQELFESRHLGLVTPEEVKGFLDKINGLSAILNETVEIDKILKLASEAESLENPYKMRKDEKRDFPETFFIEQDNDRKQETNQEKPVVAVAKDQAFCFLYRDNIDFLKRAGCNIQYFSPLEDKKLPLHTKGILLSGGYPELYGKKLSQNTAMRKEIKEKIEQGMPCIAECGGFLYLHELLEDGNGNTYKMAGVLKGKCFKKEKLGRFGYITMEAKEGGLFCEKGERVTAHEFHYWDSENPGNSFLAVKPGNGKKWEAAIMTDTFYGGFPHLYFYGNPKAAGRFVKKVKEYVNGKGL